MDEAQKIQEGGYFFPYHYLDLRSDEHRLILHVEYVSRLKTVKDLLRPFHGQLILDAGCGDGRFCYEMRGESVRMIGTDYSDKSLAFARLFNPQTEFYRQDLKNLNLPYQFDAVVLIETLEHIPPADIPIVLESLARVLTPGGKLIITVPSVNIPLAIVKKHYQHFSKNSLINTVKDHFKVLECFGHSRVRGGYGRKLFSALRKMSMVFYPFRRDFHFVYGIFDYLNNYYEKHFAIGKPEECNGIIAVCVKH